VTDLDEIQFRIMCRGVKWRKGEAYRYIEVRELQQLIVWAKKGLKAEDVQLRSQ
jgi:hypothetical protein